jgi:hypothetical protein
VRCSPGLCALLLACGPRGAAVVAAPGGAEVAVEAPSALRRLAALAVYHDDFARSVFYTWTTAAQVEALRRDRRLLVADAASGGGPTPFNRSLMALAAGSGEDAEVARVLLELPALRRRRYAWTAAYATAVPLGPRSYGDELIRVELEPSAWIARFRPGTAAPFAFVDLRGRPVAVRAALAEPSRVAAVYHVRDGADAEVPYREFVLCNAAQVRSWEVATPRLAAEVAAELELLAALRPEFAYLPAPAVRSPAAPAWARAPERPTPLALWQATLAFAGPRYRPGPGDLAAIAAALGRYAPAGPPLVGGR